MEEPVGSVGSAEIRNSSEMSKLRKADAGDGFGGDRTSGVSATPDGVVAKLQLQQKTASSSSPPCIQLELLGSETAVVVVSDVEVEVRCLRTTETTGIPRISAGWPGNIGPARDADRASVASVQRVDGRAVLACSEPRRAPETGLLGSDGGDLVAFGNRAPRGSVCPGPGIVILSAAKVSMSMSGLHS